MPLIVLLIASITTFAALLSAPLHAAPHAWVYRIDTRPPAEVYANGFSTGGKLEDLLEHALGGSCDADTPAQNSAWISTTYNPRTAIEEANRQLPGLQPLPSGVHRMWRYVIHTDSNFLTVADVLRQARTASQPGSRVVSALSHLLENTRIATQQEVVALHRILPANIESATTVSYDPELPPGRQFYQGGEPIMNPYYREPSTQMTNAVANLQALLPLTSIMLFGYEMAPQAELCALMCDGASSAHTNRIPLSATLDGVDCKARPTRSQALIGSDD